MKKILLLVVLCLFSTQALAKSDIRKLEKKIAEIEREYKEDILKIEEKHGLSAEMKQLRLKQEGEKKDLKIKQMKEKYDLKTRQKSERKALKQKERQNVVSPPAQN